ncbi:hypothetical protein [Methyloceanibacter superfactus]|uniref:hypothetical protein n=1 Tax=Methyloceanibacter superfactus TaxID=1774969 RepID=UPI00195A644B|nr:hypothetical protein [Methyloceanibacter superfactus]
MGGGGAARALALCERPNDLRLEQSGLIEIERGGELGGAVVGERGTAAAVFMHDARGVAGAAGRDALR